MFGNGTNPVGTVTPPTGSNYVLVASAGSAPSWQPTIPVTAGVDSVAFGTTGLTPVAATAGVVSVAFGTVPTAAGIYSPATNQIALSTNSTQRLLIDATGAATFSTSVTSPLLIATASRTSTATTGAISYGTNGFSDVDVLASFQSSVNSYNQVTIQNTSNGSVSSAEFIVYNDQGTAATNYATVGINSSGYTGTGSINAPGYGYFLTGSTDLVLGTIGANAIHFAVNSGATDAMTISAAGITTIASAIITSLTTPLLIGGTTASSTLTLESTSGAGTSDSIIFKTGSQVERMRIDTNGNVGIGTSSPATKLNVYTGSATNTFLRVINTAGTIDFGVLSTGEAYGGYSTNTVYYGTSAAYPALIYTNAAERMRIDSSGNVGIGTTSPQQKLDVRGNMIMPSGFIFGSLSGTTTGSINLCAGPSFNAGGASIATRGITNGYNNGGIEFYTGSGATGAEAMRIDSSGNVSIGGSGTSTGVNLLTNAQITGGTTAYAHLNSGVVQSGVTTSAIGYASSISSAAASFTTATSIHFYAAPNAGGAGSTISAQYGFLAESTLGTSGAATVTTAVGYGGNIAAGTNRWNLYMGGSANNYMAGNLGIGSTNLTAYNLNVGANITGATTAASILIGGAVQSGVTANAIGAYSAMLLAASVTTSNAIHFYANPSVGGAGSTITTQVGFLAEFTIGTQGAATVTNAYGFFGSLASGANRWNLYMNGTANNYMAGALGVGTTTVGVAGSINAIGAITFQTTTNNQSYTTTGAGTITISSGTLGTINNMSIGATTASTGAFTTVTGSTSILSTGAGGVGYATGAGGAVTQLTSRTTGVTLNKTSGAITMFTAAGSATAATFTVTNSTVAATDTISLSMKTSTNLYNLLVTAVAAGSFNITFYTTGGTTSDTPVINFNVIKGVAA